MQLHEWMSQTAWRPFSPQKHVVSSNTKAYPINAAAVYRFPGGEKRKQVQGLLQSIFKF